MGTFCFSVVLLLSSNLVNMCYKDARRRHKHTNTLCEDAKMGGRENVDSKIRRRIAAKNRGVTTRRCEDTRPLQDIVDLPKKLQSERLNAAILSCQIRLVSDPYPQTGVHCNRTWDGAMCWPDTPAGQTGVQPCANYLNGFDTSKYATRICLPNGEWKINLQTNNSWTNYTACKSESETTTRVPELAEGVAEHIGNIVVIYNVGYAVSLIFLVIAVFIMVYFRKLHCKRNTIHINLFVSFILRSAICLMEKNLIKGAGLPQDLYRDNNGRVQFKENGSHWECKLLYTVFHYILGANYMWVFVEGFYLYTLIFISVFSEKTAFKWYILFGWVSPIIFVMPWVLIRIFLQDVYCWNTHPTTGYYWVMKAPIILSIILNFIFFLMILKELFTKLRSSSRLESRRFRYRRLAKSTLVMIPLFGVYYILFICIPDYSHHSLELVKLYMESLFSSFQGLIVSLLFCFLNGEVQSEVRKKWGISFLPRRHNSGRSGTTARGSTVISTVADDVTAMRQNSLPPEGGGEKMPGQECMEMMSRPNGSTPRSSGESGAPGLNGHVNLKTSPDESNPLI